MVRGGRAEAPGPRSDVSFRLDQKTASFKAVAIPSREMQCSPLTEEKQKNELAQKEFRFIKTIIIIIIITIIIIIKTTIIITIIIIITRGGNYSLFFASISALHCSKRRQTSRWPWLAA
jgi:hypothetical protein